MNGNLMTFGLALLVAQAACAAGRVFWVDNVRGDDAAAGDAGRPYRTFARALEVLDGGDELHLVANAEPYCEQLRLTARHSGSADAPTRVFGHGATIDGRHAVASSDWRDEGDGVHSCILDNNAWPMNEVGRWCGSFPIVWFDGKAGRNAETRTSLAEGGYFLRLRPKTPEHKRIYVRLPKGRTPADVRIEVPGANVNCVLSGCSHVEVRDLKVRHQTWDCFSTNYSTNCLIDHVDGSYAMDQGISSHSSVGVQVRNSVFHHNAGGGIVDVNVPGCPLCAVTYESCSVVSNCFRCPVEFYGRLYGCADIPTSRGEFTLRNCRVADNDLSRADGSSIRQDARAYVRVCCSTVEGKIPAQALKVMSYNIRHGEGMDRRLDLRRTAAAIAAERPHVVALQEVDVGTERVRGVDTLAELARLTGLTGRFAKAIDYAGGQYGVAILSDVAPLSVRSVPLPGVEPRVLLMAEFDAVTVATTHLDLDERCRLESVKAIAAEIERSAKPVILCGDWNSKPDSSVLAALGQTVKVVSRTDCGTFHGPDEGARGECIDYIAVDGRHARRFEARDRRVIPDERTSDHKPIVVTLVEGN